MGHGRSARLWSRLAAACVLLGSGTCWTCASDAETSTFRTYATDAGFTSVGGRCLLQDGAGYLLACSEQGVFAYDGRRFMDLGVDQGLRRGGTVYGLALTSTGRLAVEYGNEIFVADQTSGPSRPPTSLSFQAVEHPGITFYSERAHRLAAWRGGLVLLAGDDLVRVTVPTKGPGRVDTVGYTGWEQSALHGATAVFSVHDRLWETFDDGRICSADPGAVRCYTAADGMSKGPWFDIVAGNGTQVLARSSTRVATIDPSLDHVSIVDLPDQGNGRYANVLGQLSLFRGPDGRLMTQADHGLAVLDLSGWRPMSVEDGAPSGTIASVITDATGQLWFQMFGQGLVRWVGYGQWQAIGKGEGLSDGFPWEIARPPGGSLWVATDTGIDEILQQDGHLRVGRCFRGTSFALAVGPRGDLWSSFGAAGVRVIDPATGAATTLAVPDVDTIVADKHAMWFGTEKGLFRVQDHAGSPMPVRVGEGQAQVPALVADGSGGAFYLSGDRLRHWHGDGSDHPVLGQWPGNGFHPIDMARDPRGTWWAVGDNGFYRFTMSADRLTSLQEVPAADTLSSSILTIMVDHRGWVWSAGNLGVSVFDGRRWVSVTSDTGLLFDDTQQHGLWEDPDGSVWISTSHGLSHLLHPSSLFAEKPLHVVIAGATVGDHALRSSHVPYTEEAVTVELGTPDFVAERSLLFRYRLSGVDAHWVTSSSGVVRYPFVPPGRHVFVVTGYDELTHQASPPAKLTIKIAWPWWRQSWFETLVMAGLLLGGSGGIYAAMRFRYRIFYRRQAELESLVKERTAQLEFVAIHDALTGLLTRSESERRLAAQLAANPEPGSNLVVLLDIDHFKRINDECGHIGGDDVLRTVGLLVRKGLRSGEYAGRFGGEEMLIVLDDYDGRGAERVLELHTVFRGTEFNADGTEVRVTCSVGLAWTVRNDTWKSLLRRADEALYEAKSNGRDRIVERVCHDPQQQIV